MPGQDPIDQKSLGPMNVALACRVVEKCLEVGVTEVCLCAGGRNSPFVVALQSCPQIHVWHFFEERSAAYFALGRSVSLGREPVAVCTTSGTAAGELLPAIMEAYYSGVPLIALTADRPRAFRGTGAPQSAEQVGLFSHYSAKTFDVTTFDEIEEITLADRTPHHINVCFAEPLLDGSARISPAGAAKRSLREQISSGNQLKEALSVIKRPLLILSQLPPNPLISKMAQAGNCLIYAEGHSQQRRMSESHLRAGADRLPALISNGSIDGIIRLGGVPTLRLWRDLEDRYSKLPVVSLCSPQFSGLSRRSFVFPFLDSHLEVLFSHLESCDDSRVEETLEADAADFARLNRLLELHPESEPGWMRWISENLAPEARVFLGNSLPVREWDLAAAYDDKHFDIHSSRGLNGIDGQISTFLGWAAKARSNTGVFGDLTALYDLSAPWILRQTPDLNLKIILINNRGGQIFDRMFGNPWFINAHGLSFRNWARLWDLEYIQGKEMLGSAARQIVVEIQPDPEATKAFWQEYAQ